MNIQFKKGVLELCVLAMLEKGDRYGYEIASNLSQAVDISDGTVYPILRRLKQENYVTSYLEESSGGAPRKYYALSPSGREVLELLKAEWKHFIFQVDQIIDGGEEIEQATVSQ